MICKQVLGVVCLLLAPMLSQGCQSPQTEAAKAVNNELAERQANQAKAGSLYRQASQCQESGDCVRAAALLREAVQLDPRNANAWIALGVAAYEQDQVFEAAAAFDHAGRLVPNQYEPQFNTGIILETAGRYSQAAKSYEAALKLAPDQIEVMENLARCYVRISENLPRAGELIDKALLYERRPTWQAWLLRQQILLGSGPATQPALIGVR